MTRQERRKTAAEKETDCLTCVIKTKEWLKVRHGQPNSIIGGGVCEKQQRRDNNNNNNNGFGSEATFARDLPITPAAGFSGAALTRSVTGQRQRGIANGRSILQRSAAQSCFMISN